MADKKISALTAATTPLAGTEVLPIVQGGNTVKVSVANLTAGRSISASGLEVTGTVRFVDSTSAGPDLEFGNVGGGTYVNNVANARTYLGAYELVFTNYNNSTEWVRIDNSGNVNAAIGNVKIGTAGKGIDFSANTHAAGMTKEVLNWYEEGTWTPTDTSTAGLTLSVAYAKYTRIGRAVFINAFVTYPATADSNNASIGGLPFAVDGANYPPFTVLTDSGTAIGAFANATANDFAFTAISNYTTKIANSTLSAKGVIISGCYFTL